MTRRKTKSASVPPPPEEADAFTAKEAMGSGHEHPVGEYVGDLAEVLSVLASLLDPTDTQKRGLQLRFVEQGERRHVSAKKKPTSPEDDAEWEGSLLQVKEAIETGNAVAVGWYLGDAADFLNRLAAILTGQTGSEDRRLKFHRKGRGKPSDPSKAWTDAAIARELEDATRRSGKQEAAIAEVEAKRGISRATILRAKKKHSTSARKSHK